VPVVEDDADRVMADQFDFEILTWRRPETIFWPGRGPDPAADFRRAGTRRGASNGIGEIDFEPPARPKAQLRRHGADVDLVWDRLSEAVGCMERLNTRASLTSMIGMPSRIG
jgi:hypothetical protein